MKIVYIVNRLHCKSFTMYNVNNSNKKRKICPKQLNKRLHFGIVKKLFANVIDKDRKSFPIETISEQNRKSLILKISPLIRIVKNLTEFFHATRFSYKFLIQQMKAKNFRNQ